MPARRSPRRGRRTRCGSGALPPALALIAGGVALHGVMGGAIGRAMAQGEPSAAETVAPFLPGTRWFEYEVPAAGEAALVPVEDAELKRLLEAHRFRGLVLRTPADSSVDPAPWIARFAPELLVVVAPRSTTRIDEQPAWPAADDTVVAARSIHPPAALPMALLLKSARRPAVRGALWCASAPPPDSTTLLVRSLLLRPTPDSLRAEQLRLDLASFGRAPLPPMPPLLSRQSALADWITSALSGPAPELLDAFTLEASSEPFARGIPGLRRAPAALDPEEWLLSPDRLGRLLLERLPWSGGRRPVAGDPPPWDDEPPTAAVANRSDGEAGEIRGILSSAEIARAAEAFIAGVAAAARHGQRKAGVPLVPAPPVTAELPVADPPWRLRFRDWRVLDAAPDAPRPWLRTVRIDDPALEPFRDRIEEALGPSTFDRRELGTASDGSLRLATTLALRDPTFGRLRVAAEAELTVHVDGRVVIEPVALSGPLLATLALPAGTSELKVTLGPKSDRAGPSDDSRVSLELELLPQRAAARVMSARTATRAEEPVVRIGDPAAFDQQSLVRRAGPDIGGSGDAFLPFELDRPGRFDLWLHALTPPGEEATLRVATGTVAAREIRLPAADGWQWHRVAAPFDLDAGADALRVTLGTDSSRLDQAAWMPSELAFPRPPPGDRALWDHAWRFDPLGVGLVLDLTTVRPGERFGRVFELEKGGTYRLFAWRRGDEPLHSERGGELELTSASARVRLLLPPGSPVEEWVSLGDVALLAGERIELMGHGDGAPARVALVR